MSGHRFESSPTAWPIYLFYAGLRWPARLLLFEVDAFIFVTANCLANLRGSLAQLCLLVGKEAFFGAGGTLRPVHRFKATTQAGMAQGAVATAVARQLINHAAHLGDLLINVDLPGITEIIPRELVSGNDGRKRSKFERGRGMVSRHIV